ncbi:MAG: LacI family DNA-binding transcriptional regulator [Pseudobutyrivibrio sp.]|nr:LacI family DNA-binding transcriptional regulator [Pseudobutyrivibrio sp.]
MAKKKTVSVKLIAEKCGVSTATISRVLNADPKVAEATRQKVMEALKELNYKPAERNTNIPKKVAVITRVSHQDYYVSLVHEINKYMAEQGYDVISLSQENSIRSLPGLLDTAYSSNVAGVIIVTADYSSIKNKLMPSIPHVWIDCNEKPDDIKDICTVESDHYVSGRLAAHALINQGCKKPIIITGNNPSRRSAERKSGFFDEFKEAGILLSNDNIIEVQTGTDGFTVTREAVRYVIAKGLDFDSIFAISDWRALGAYTGVITMGKKVPEDIRIIGFDGLSLACKTVGITSIQQNTPRLAACSCDQLIKLINGETVQEKHIVIPTGILQGQTLPEPNIM